MKDNIHIILDSVSAVQETEYVNDARIHLIRLIVNHGDEEWLDGERSLEDMFALVKKTGKLPRTSQPPIGKILEMYNTLINQGKKVIFITVDSALSGTYQTACSVAKQVMDANKEADIRVIDSKTAAAPITGFAMQLLQKIDSGCEDMDELERYGNDLVARTATYFSVNTLEYLRKGGRIGKASALIGSILGIRPILHLDKEGRVEVADKCRSRKKVLKRIVEIANDEGALEAIYVSNACAEEDATTLEQEMQALYPGVPTLKTSIGTVLSAHLGPGVIGLFVTRKKS